MAKKDNSALAPAQMFAHLDELHLKGIEDRIAKGEYVSAEELAEALRKHGSRPIPPCILEYLCRLLEGEIAKPKGRKALPAVEKRREQAFVRYFYRRYFTWLRNRKARYGNLEGWSAIRQAKWWQGPPHERAARMVAERFGQVPESWGTFRNMASSQK